MNGPFIYDQKTARFRGAGGRFLRGERVKEATLRSFDQAAKATRALGEQLQRGEISLGEWQTLMAREIKNATLYAAGLANGGWDNLSPADFGRVGRWLAQGPAGGMGQYQYLQRFAEQIEAGLPLDGMFLRRCEMYIHQANQYYERERSRIREVMGYDEVRNRRHARDSCPGCLSETARGWVPKGEISFPGQRECRVNCRCYLQYRNSLTGDIAA